MRVLELEVTDQVSVDAAVARVEAEDGRLDALVNNAGIPGARAGRAEPAIDR